MALVLASGTVSYSALPPNAPAIYQLTQRGMALLKQIDLYGAVGALSAALPADPSPKAYRERGEIFGLDPNDAEAGSTPTASAQADAPSERRLTLSSDDGRPGLVLAASTATPQLQQASTPPDAPAVDQSTQPRVALLKQISLYGAVGALSAALRADPSAKAYREHGEIFAKKGDLQNAIAHFSAAIRLDPKDAAAYRGRGLAFADRNDANQAIADLTSAILLAVAEPGLLSSVDLFLAYRSRAMLYDMKELYDREISDLTQMVDTYWKSPDVADALTESWGSSATKAFLASIYKLRAKAHARMTLFDKALADLSIAIELDPAHAAGAYSDRAEIEENLGKHDRAVTDFRAAVKLDPNMKGPKDGLVRLESEPPKK